MNDSALGANDDALDRNKAAALQAAHVNPNGLLVLIT